jgi:hypothetical protein
MFGKLGVAPVLDCSKFIFPSFTMELGTEQRSILIWLSGPVPTRDVELYLYQKTTRKNIFARHTLIESYLAGMTTAQWFSLLYAESRPITQQSTVGNPSTARRMGVGEHSTQSTNFECT